MSCGLCRLRAIEWIVVMVLAGGIVASLLGTVGQDVIHLRNSSARRSMSAMHWREMDSDARFMGAAVVSLGTTVVLVGGEDAGRSSQRAVRTLSTRDGSLAAILDLEHPRTLAAAVAVDEERVLVVGGILLDHAEEIDEAESGSTAEWVDVARAQSVVLELPYAPYLGHSVTMLGDGRVLVIGGEDSAGRAAIFDTALGLWVEVTSLPEPRRGHTATLLDDGRVLVTGGVNPVTSTLVTSVLAFDPELGEWQALPSMRESRTGHTVTRLGDGQLLVTGGRTESGERLASVERVSPAASTFEWTRAGSLSTPRSHHCAALLPDGSVVVVAGVDESMNGIVESEVYDPTNDVWEPGPVLPEPRSEASCVDTGEALYLIGGYGPGGFSDVKGTVFRLEY